MRTAASSSTRARAREPWLDVIRGGAMLLVIATHAIDIPSQSAGLPPGTLVADVAVYFSPFRMPTLMLLSGLLLPRALAKPPRRYVANKLRTLAWPYVLWLIVFWFVTANPTEWMDPSGWATRTWLWYILCLLLLSLAAPLLTRIPGAWFAAVPLTLWALSGIAPDGMAFELSYYGGFFFAGYLIAQHRAHLRRFDTTLNAALLLAVASVFAVFVVLQHHGGALGPEGFIGSDSAGHIERFDVAWVPLVLSGIAGTALLVRRLPGVRRAEAQPPLVRFLQHIGRNSIVFYLVHYPLMILLVAAFSASGVTSQPIVMTACILISLAVSFTAVALRRHPAVNLLFTFPTREAAPHTALRSKR